MEIAGLMGRDLSGVDSIETTIGDRLTIFEGELEDALEEEIDEYQQWWDEASKAWGECGKPLKHRYMAVQIENMIKDGADPEEVIPQTVQRIIRKVRDVDTAVEVFEGEVGEEAVVAAKN